MLVLIDKYGCPGFKLTKGSTPYLVIGIIIFKTSSAAEKASRAIKKLKKQLNISPEFKFTKTNIKAKEIFFEKICRYNFEIRVIIADKAGIHDPGLRDNAMFFYEYLVTTLIKNNEDLLLNTTLKINKSIDKKFQSILKKHLQKNVEQHTIKKFKFSDSKTDPLIQLADMIIGIIAKNYTDESIISHKLFNKLVKNKKIKSIWKLRESSNTLH